MLGRILCKAVHTKEAKSSLRPQCGAWAEKPPQNGEQILVVQKISLCCSARGWEDKHNQRASFEGGKA